MHDNIFSKSGGCCAMGEQTWIEGLAKHQEQADAVAKSAWKAISSHMHGACVHTLQTVAVDHGLYCLNFLLKLRQTRGWHCAWLGIANLCRTRPVPLQNLRKSHLSCSPLKDYTTFVTVSTPGTCWEINSTFLILKSKDDILKLSLRLSLFLIEPRHRRFRYRGPVSSKVYNTFQTAPLYTVACEQQQNLQHWRRKCNYVTPLSKTGGYNKKKIAQGPWHPSLDHLLVKKNTSYV